MNKTALNRSSFYIAVNAYVINGDQVLLGCRQNTGWYDGYFDSIGGHLEVGESLTKAVARELYEEANLKVNEEDLKLFHISHYLGDKLYLYLFFQTDKYEGILKNKEPDFLSGLAFYPISKLPAKTTPYAKAAIKDLNSSSVTYSYFEGNGPNEP